MLRFKKTNGRFNVSETNGTFLSQISIDEGEKISEVLKLSMEGEGRKKEENLFFGEKGKMNLFRTKLLTNGFIH